MYILALDLGASSYRAVVGEIDESGRRVRVVWTERWPNQMISVGPRLYWDILGIWASVKTSVRQAYRTYREMLASIGIDSWGVDFVLIDSLGELVGLPVAYRDQRTEGVMEEVFKRVPREEVYRMTGVQFMRINTLYQLYSMILRRDPKLGVARRLLMIPDLLHYWLSGEAYTEYTNASTTQLLDPWRRTWSWELIERLGIPREIFPEIVEPGTVLGRLSEALARELGVSREVLVTAPATHDTASAVAAGPMVSGDTAYISSGTWSLVGVELESPLVTREAMELNFTNEGGVFGTIRFLKNVQGMWIIEEVRRVLREREGVDLSYDEINRLASSTERVRAFIDPDHESLVAPRDMVEAVYRYIEETGQERPTGYGELFKTIYTSLVLKYRLVIEQLERVTGRRIRAVNIFGGASRNEFLNQLIADATERVVYAGPDEASSLGNILVQARGLGLVRSLRELREYVRNSCEIRTFYPRGAGLYEDYYEEFLEKTGLSREASL